MGRPRATAIEKLEAALAESSDEGSARSELELEALKSKARRIPFIDPIDIRYRRYEATPKPIAQAVMFCLMDVSGSMSEHMKDLAKRFYMLLYVFLKRRYRYVEIVFIRHTIGPGNQTNRRSFTIRRRAARWSSSALPAMHEIVRARYRPADWNIYAAQASDGDNSYADSELTGRLLAEAILPVTQFFAYLEVGNSGGKGRRFEIVLVAAVPAPAFGGRNAVHAQGARPQRNLPGLSRIVQPAPEPKRSRIMTEAVLLP